MVFNLEERTELTNQEISTAGNDPNILLKEREVQKKFSHDS